MSITALAPLLALVLADSAFAAPSSYASDVESLQQMSHDQILRHFTKRQGESKEGAAIILTLIFVGVIFAVSGGIFAWLRGQPKRQKWCLNTFCCCCPCTKDFGSDEKFKDAVVYNGYGEVMAPVAPASIDPTMWKEALDENGKPKQLTPEQAIQMMTIKAAAEGPLVNIPVPDSVKQLQDTPLVDGSTMAREAAGNNSGKFEALPDEEEEEKTGGQGTKIAPSDD